ncbi:MAG: hypothetical protein AAF378_11880 [Cyanobacteria bacterium P01_A01_bin.84]
MKRAIFLDIEGTLTETISNTSDPLNSEYVNSKNVKILPGVETALNYYFSQEPDQLIVGISNKGEDGEIDLEAEQESEESENSTTINVPIQRPQNNVDIVIEEMKHTLSLLPQLKAIYFCPNIKGRSCWRVTRTGALKISNNSTNQENYIPQKHSFRKPGAGMIFIASLDYDIDLDQSWMVSNTPEDANAAHHAQIDLIQATEWRGKFLSVT